MTKRIQAAEIRFLRSVALALEVSQIHNPSQLLKSAFHCPQLPIIRCKEAF